jgi:phosphotransferase system IIA component
MNKKFTLHELALNTPGESSTRHILEDAEKIPEKIMQQLKGYMPFKVKKTLTSEQYQILSCEWASIPDQTEALNTQKTLTRDLKINLKWQKNGINMPLEIIMPSIPVPGVTGAYIYGENTSSTPGEYFFTQKLIQKPGIFPINLEEDSKSAPKPAILFESLELTTIQTESELLINFKSTNVNAYKCQTETIKIPKDLWQEFDNLIREARNNLYVRWENHPEIDKELKKGFGFKNAEDARARLNEWITKVATQQIPQGEWQKRFGDHPNLAKATPWDFTKSEKINALLTNPRGFKFLEVNDLGRKYLEGAPDVTAQIISQEILNCLNQTRFSGKELKTHVFAQNWKNRPWADILATRCILDGTNRQQNDGSTPIKTVLIANKIEIVNDTINPEGIRGDTEREYHTSFIGGIAPTATENSDVGRTHKLCSGAKVNPVTKEVLRPVKVITQTEEGPKLVNTWMTCEDIELLQNKLSKQRPELRNIGYGNTDEIPELQVGEVFACLDMSADDHLPLSHLLCPNIRKDSAARYAVLEAFLAGASPVVGAGINSQDNAASLNASKIVINNGEILYSPVSGTIKRIDTKNPKIIITTDNGEIEIPFYCNMSNAYENERGLKAMVIPGQKIEAGQVILQPDNPCVTEDQKLALGAQLVNVEWSTIEDERYINESVLRSGRFTMKKNITVKTEGLTSGSIRLSTIQPGTLIKEGMLLGVRIVTKEAEPGKPPVQESIPWVASSKETGILKAVYFIDKDMDSSNTFDLSVETEALEPVDVFNETMSLLHIDIQEFHNYMRNWNIPFQESCEEFDIDLKPSFETLKYEVLINDEWIEKTFHLSELTSGSEKIKELRRDLQLPDTEFKVDLSYSILNERICRNTRINILKIADVALNPINLKEIQKHKKVNRVDFIIEHEYPIKVGSKVACPDGTKGTVVIKGVHEMPLIQYQGKTMSAECCSNTLAVISRGSIGSQQNTGIDPAEKIQKSFYYESDGFSAVTVELREETLMLQGGSDPEKSNHLGMDLKNRGIAKGTKVSADHIVEEMSPLLDLNRAITKREPSRSFLQTFTPGNFQNPNTLQMNG